MNSNFLPVAVAVGVLSWCGQERLHAQETVVETFTGTVVLSVDLPGSIDPPGPGCPIDCYRFHLSLGWAEIDFAPGAVEYGGEPIDLDGLEELVTEHGPWMGMGSTSVHPDLPGPGEFSLTTVDGETKGTITLPLGPDFTAEYFDVEIGGPGNVMGQPPVPYDVMGIPIDPHDVMGIPPDPCRIEATGTVISVDAAGEGGGGGAQARVEIRIDAGQIVMIQPPQIPAVTPWGLCAAAMLLLLGGMVLLVRRRGQRVATQI